jgi:transposase
LSAKARESLSDMAAIVLPSSCRTGTFLKAARAEKSDITLQALCDRLSAERGVKADTSMMSRFFRRIGVTFKKDPRGVRPASSRT